MVENQTPATEINFFKDFITKMWRNALLVIIVMVLAVVGGVGYSHAITPTYTARIDISYTAELESNSNPVDNISIMKDMMQSVVDLSITEIVLEEANYLYDKFEHLPLGTTVDEFIESVKSGNSSFVADFNRDIPNIVENKYFSPDSVNAKALGETDAITGPKYIYEISVSEIEPTEAVKKARILALAGSRVAKEFFDGYKTNLNELIKDSNGVRVSSDVSLKKNVLVALVIGFVLSVALVYLKYFLDNTASDKEEIERITGTTVIAFIEDQEER